MHLASLISAHALEVPAFHCFEQNVTWPDGFSTYQVVVTSPGCADLPREAVLG